MESRLQFNSPISQIPHCIYPVSHNVPFRTEMSILLFWMMFCTWTNVWANNQDAGDLRHHHTHYDVTAIKCLLTLMFSIKFFELNWIKWIVLSKRGHFNNAYELLRFQCCIKITSFNVWVRSFVWNFKGYLWNSTQNILPIHRKM